MDNEETTVRCPRCDSSDVEFRANRDENRKQYLCRTCEERGREPKYFIYRSDEGIPEYKSTKFPGARILLFDIETAPMEVYVGLEKSAQVLESQYCSSTCALPLSDFTMRTSPVPPYFPFKPGARRLPGPYWMFLAMFLAPRNANHYHPMAKIWLRAL